MQDGGIDRGDLIEARGTHDIAELSADSPEEILYTGDTVLLEGGEHGSPDGRCVGSQSDRFEDIRARGDPAIHDDPDPFALQGFFDLGQHHHRRNRIGQPPVMMTDDDRSGTDLRTFQSVTDAEDALYHEGELRQFHVGAEHV